MRNRPPTPPAWRGWNDFREHTRKAASRRDAERASGSLRASGQYRPDHPGAARFRQCDQRHIDRGPGRRRRCRPARRTPPGPPHPRTRQFRPARPLLMDARVMSADEAVLLGIADRKVSDDRLDTAALDLARELAEGPTAAYAAIRRLTEAAATNSLATHLDEETREIVALAGREDVRAALSTPLTRTKAVFTR